VFAFRLLLSRKATAVIIQGGAGKSGTLCLFIYLFIYLLTTHEAANSGKYLLNGGFVCVGLLK